MTITKHTVEASITVPTYYTPASVVPVFADGFDAGAALWQITQGGTVMTPQTNPTTGLPELRSAWAWDGITVGHYGGIGHLNVPTTIGKVYMIRAYARTTAPAQIRASVNVGTHVAGGGWITLAAGATGYASWIFIATASMSNPAVHHADIGFATDASTVYWQSVSVYEMTASTVLDLHPVSATVTLDESWSPYVRATLVCPIPPANDIPYNPDVLASIDPRPSPPKRVSVRLAGTDTDSRTLADLTVIYAGKTLADLTTQFAGGTLADLTALFGDQFNGTTTPYLSTERTMDLMLRTRNLDYVAGTMTLELVSDELALQDIYRIETATGTFLPPVTTSLQTLVSWGLSFLGAVLQPGWSDAQVPSSANLWDLGDSLWDFLDASIRANNLRLWCDERRRWYLTPTLTGASGAAVVRALTRMDDSLSRNDPAYGDAVAMVFEYVDGAGVRQRSYRYDWVPGTAFPKMVVQQFNSPDPDPLGTAGGPYWLRQRSMTRGRVVALDAVSDYSVTPGQALTLTTTVTTVTGTMLSAVTWSLPQDTMTIRTRDAS